MVFASLNAHKKHMLIQLHKLVYPVLISTVLDVLQLLINVINVYLPILLVRIMDATNVLMDISIIL